MRRLFTLPLLMAAALLLVCSIPAAHAGATLDRIRAAGTLTCGVITDEEDYSEADRHGDLSMLGADYCRALAAELFADAGKARFLTLRDEPDGLAALRDGKVDVLFGATPNPVIGAIYKAAFGPPLFFDGQGFLVSDRSGIKTLAGLAGRHVCFINASPPEQLLYDALDPQLAKPSVHFPFTERGEMIDAFIAGHCDAVTGDISWMANVRAGIHARASTVSILPGTISVDPFSPAYRRDDPQFASLVDWTVWALLQAEEHGVTQADIGAMRGSPDPVARRLAGSTSWIAKSLGLPEDGFARAIAAVGNFGEIYDRDVGEKSALRLPRGRNALASNGGLMWALPVEPLQ